MTQDANDILMGSGAPSAKFPHVGDVVAGTLTREPEARQQRDFRTNQPETWKDGSPKMMVVVQLSTAERDPQRPDDDGTRTLYVQGKHLTDAVRQAVRASGANGLHTGGQLTVQYIADGQAENGLNAPKLYAAQYTPPAVSFAGVTAPTGQQAQPTQAVAAQPQYAPGFAPQAPFGSAPVAQQQQVPAQVPATAAAPQQQLSPAAAVIGAPQGVDPNMWARMNPDQQQRVLAAMGNTMTAQQAGF